MFYLVRYLVEQLQYVQSQTTKTFSLKVTRAGGSMKGGVFLQVGKESYKDKDRRDMHRLDA